MSYFFLFSVLLAQVAGGPPPVGDDGDQIAESSSGPDHVEVGESGLLDVRFRNVDIIIALEMLSEQTLRNIVAHDGVSGQVSMVLRKVTFEEALDTMLSARGLTHVERRNVIHVMPELSDDPMEKLEMRVFRLNYMTAGDAEALIKPLLSDSATTSRTADAEVGIGSNSESAGGFSPTYADVLIVVDYPVNLARVATVLKSIDVRPKQVLVEATIMRTTLNEQNALGIDFNTLDGVDFQLLGGVSPGVTEISVGAIPSSRLKKTNITTRTDFNHIVPDGGLTFGIVKNQVAAFIRALEQITDVTILANPKLLTLNKQRGEVIVGRRDGYLTTTVTQTAAVQTVEFLETGTRLIFRPFVLADGNVRMEIHPEDSNGGLTSANLPFQETTEVTVNILLKDGHTILIGGLFRERTTATSNRVPLLGNIPILGQLFGVNQNQTVREEIIILLTVHVLDSPDDGQELVDEAVENIERVRVGARRGLMGIGREQLAEARYRRALEHLQAGDLDKALSAVRMALHMTPRHIAAIRLQERLLKERMWHADGAVLRSFVHDLIRAEAGLEPLQRYGRPDVGRLIKAALPVPNLEDAETEEGS